MKFKVGDKVRRVGPNNTRVEQGKVYTVESVSTHTGGIRLVGGKNYTYHSKFFNLYKAGPARHHYVVYMLNKGTIWGGTSLEEATEIAKKGSSMNPGLTYHVLETVRIVTTPKTAEPVVTDI